MGPQSTGDEQTARPPSQTAAEVGSSLTTDISATSLALESLASTIDTTDVSVHPNTGSVAELKQLLELRDQEILSLKIELDKYRIALRQLEYQLLQQQQSLYQRLHTSDSTDDNFKQHSIIHGHSHIRSSVGSIPPLDTLANLLDEDPSSLATMVADTTSDYDRTIEVTQRARCSTSPTLSSTGVIFKTRRCESDHGNGDDIDDGAHEEDGHHDEIDDDDKQRLLNTKFQSVDRNSNREEEIIFQDNQIEKHKGEPQDHNSETQEISSRRRHNSEFMQSISEKPRNRQLSSGSQQMSDSDVITGDSASLSRADLLDKGDIQRQALGEIEDIDDSLKGLIDEVSDVDLDLQIARTSCDISLDRAKQSRKPGYIFKRASERGLQSTPGERNDISNISRNINSVGGDMISDGILTSLTDAAFSNLSQLAALQGRCESQQQQNVQHQQRLQQPNQHLVGNQQGPGVQRDQQPRSNSAAATLPSHQHHRRQTPSPTVGPMRPETAQFMHMVDGYPCGPNVQQRDVHRLQVGGAPRTRCLGVDISSPHQSKPQSSTDSFTPVASHDHDDQTSSSGHSLANAVAAAAEAAAAAAAASEHRHQQLGSHDHHQLHLTHSRLISSAMNTSELYHQLGTQQQHHQHSQSPSMQFSPSNSITPSPTGLISSSGVGSSGITRGRSTTSNLSLSSGVSSPNYLRRMTMMSPSSTSGSFGSVSLAHLLHHHHHHHSSSGATQQQRSVSALGTASMVTSGPSPTNSSSMGTGTGSASSAVMSPLLASKSSTQVRLNNMQIRHKFGYLGSGRAQFNSPHGFCLGLNQEIVVADTNNHRVCIFDKSGAFITQFGSPGKEEGQLWNPRKVAILHRTASTSSASSSSSNQQQQISGNSSYSNPKSHRNQTYSSQLASSGSNVASVTSVPNHSTSGVSHLTDANKGPNPTDQAQTIAQLSDTEPLYVVCDRGAERSRMQLFTKDGSFIKKIGIHYIDIVAGLAITQSGLIIVVDSVSPTVYIINGETGTLNGWFDCSGHMKEPSDIAVKSDVPCNEYFICDFKGHCVVVFNEQGQYLRKIGAESLTSYPNGIDISDDGDILVGDSHGNRFHVVVFDRNGTFVSQFECPHVKVSRCCGLKITREGYIVTLAKNNHHVLVLDTIHI